MADWYPYDRHAPGDGDDTMEDGMPEMGNTSGPATANDPVTTGTVHAQPRWAMILQRPFPPEQISKRPQPWCPKCKDSPSYPKHCAEHAVKKCPGCKMRISEAHFDLDYVGHADVTMRLNEADPAWTWEPMYRDLSKVDPELMKIAAEKQDLRLLRELKSSAPALLDEWRGLWIWLIIHDENGQEVIRKPGYGDSVGKSNGPTAVKELIGDAIRNAAMRLGVATLQWSKNDLAESSAAPGGLQAGSPVQGHRSGGSEKATEAVSETSPVAQAMADAATAANDLAALSSLHKTAGEKRLLRSKVKSPDGNLTTLGGYLNIRRGEVSG